MPDSTDFLDSVLKQVIRKSNEFVFSKLDVRRISRSHLIFIKSESSRDNSQRRIHIHIQRSEIIFSSFGRTQIIDDFVRRIRFYTSYNFEISNLKLKRDFIDYFGFYTKSIIVFDAYVDGIFVSVRKLFGRNSRGFNPGFCSEQNQNIQQ